jgi:hypothetical protein
LLAPVKASKDQGRREGGATGHTPPVWIPVAKPSEPSDQQPNQCANPSPSPMSFDWMALKFLEPWTPEDLALAIRSGVTFDLSPFLGIVEEVAILQILEWFKKYRPDLYAVLATEEGVAWLRKNIRLALKR